MGAFFLMLTIQGTLLARIAVYQAPVEDEIAHLPAGLSHWRYGNFTLYRVNPPLMRMLVSAPLLLASPQENWDYLTEEPYARPEFGVGQKFLLLNGANSLWYFRVARWAQIGIVLLGGAICFFWARGMFGGPAGLVALTLWCFDPNILAWGATITPDVGAATFGIGASYAFWGWLRSPKWMMAILAGFVLGLAELSKSTWIILFALWPIVWTCWIASSRRETAKSPPLRQLAVVIVLGLYVLNLGYAFEKSFQRLEEFSFISRSLGGSDAHQFPGNRFRGTWFGKLPVPVPANYLNGLDVQKYEFEQGKWSYLRGELRRGGWWYYYVYAMAVKTPIGTLALIALSAALALGRREFRIAWRDATILLIPAAVVLILVSSQTGFNRYLRYVIPTLPFLFVFAASAARDIAMRGKLITAIIILCLTASAVSSLMIYPHSMSYFNIVAGGPLQGPRHLLDANVDWGQDLLELGRFLDQNPDARPIHLVYFGFADPELAGIQHAETRSLGADQDAQERPIDPGWYAISVNHLYGYQYFESHNREQTRFQRFIPVARAGYSIYIYHLTEEELFETRPPIP